MEKILIIIPAYNEADSIEKVVDDIIENFPQYDYVVVNDCSSDDTRKICKKREYNLLDLPTETIINFLLVYEAIDFSFWGNPKWTIDTSNGKEDGSIAFDIELERGVHISAIIKDEMQFEIWEDTLPFYYNVRREGVEIGAE